MSLERNPTSIIKKTTNTSETFCQTNEHIFLLLILTMIKSSVFANKKISSGLNVFGTPANSSGATTSSSFFDSSLQQNVVPSTTTTGRNWQATPTNSRRLAAAFPIQSLLHPSNSSTSLRNPIMAPTAAISNTPSMRVKPYTLSGLVESLNEVCSTISSHRLINETFHRR